MKKLVCLLLVLLFIPACSSTLVTNTLFYVKYKDSSYFLSSIDGKINNKIQTNKRIKGFRALPENKSFIIDVLLSPGVNVDSNELFLMQSSGKIEAISKEYASDNLKISPDGSKMAFTIYTADDLNSYKGVYISDIKGNMQKINTTKRITQGLYEWLDNRNLLFYGIDVYSKDLSKIYLYDTQNKRESIFYDGISGYCSFFAVNEKSSILFIEEGNASEKKLKIINLKNKTSKDVKFLYDTIYDVSFSPDGNYAAITASETSDDEPHIFIYNLAASKMEMNLTDYPDEVTASKGYMVWEGDKLYFYGKNEDVYSLYCMDIISKEIKCITDQSENCMYPQKVQN